MRPSPATDKPKRQLADVHPRDWTPAQRAEWITAYKNEKPGILPIPFHPAGACGFCEIFHRLIDEANAREAASP